MNWVVLALLAPAIYAIVNFIDKHLVSNEIKDYKAMPIYTSFVALIAGTIFWFATGFPVLETKDAAIIMATGIITVWSLFLYFRALAEEETTTIIILFQTLPVLSLIFGYFILGEIISTRQLLGFILILSSAIGITIKPRKKGERIISESFFLILAFNVMWALSGVLIKFAINANSFSEILSYESWGIALGGAIVFILFPGIRRSFTKNLKTVKNRTLGILFVNESVFVVAKSISFSAFALGPVALVSVLSSTQVFFGIAYGYALTKLFPKYFNEGIDKKSLIKKGVLATLLFVGIILLA